MDGVVGTVRSGFVGAPRGATGRGEPLMLEYQKSEFSPTGHTAKYLIAGTFGVNMHTHWMARVQRDRVACP